MGNTGRNDAISDTYEYCPHCDANLTLQKGYANDLPYWKCKGCGTILLNPNVPSDSDIAWFCDNCDALLNIQSGFDETAESFQCKVCGHINGLSAEDIFLTDDEYEAFLQDIYAGLSDEEVLLFSEYEEICPLADRDDVMLVKHVEDGKLYVKKILATYNEPIFRYLIDHPIAHMPRVLYAFEGANALITIEEYIPGRSFAEECEERLFSEREAAVIGRKLCDILSELHAQTPPIIHRDIKPSNVMLTADGEVYLLDVNIAKFYDASREEDTKLLGTTPYAAPEQAGFGLQASSEKTDVYGLAILLNELLTGAQPKERHPEGDFWKLISQCISLDPQLRPTVREVADALDEMIRSTDE